ncbi:MAG: MHYT domain-containing protein [Ferrovibrio sp.]
MPAADTAFLSIPLTESYQPELVALSLAVIFFAGFTALTLAGRFQTSSGQTRFGWLLGSAIALGGGIWSMHFVAMLSFDMGMPVRYAPGLTVVSFLVAVAVVALGLAIVAVRPGNRTCLLLAGVIAGLGVSAMHYTGMAAMQMGATIRWDTPLVVLSVLIGIAASSAALWLSFNSRSVRVKLGASVLMTAAVAGMHYTGMAAASYIPVHGALDTIGGLSSEILAVAVASASFLILFLALLAAMFDETLANRAQAEAMRLRNMNEQLESMVAKRTVELLREKQRAVRASNAKTDFLASMSHELRTPLNAVIGYSEILMEEAEERDDGSARGDLEKIHTAGKHILALINDILDLSKIEAGKMELSVDRTQLKDLIDDSLAVCRRLLEANNNRCTVVHNSAVLQMDTDVTKLRQAIINLLGNAAKFTNNGEVTIETRSIRQDDADWISITVRDTGVGIAPEFQADVFEDFHRGDSNTARHHGGTGLGLALSQRLVRLLGGDITLVSAVGQGAAFTIRVPAQIQQSVDI